MVSEEQCLCGINPGGLCDKSCEVVQPTTLDDLYRVYCWEWVLVYSSAAVDGDGEEEAIDHFKEKYAGRVWDEHWQVLLLGPGLASQLTLLLPTLKGEYKHEDFAQRARVLAEITGEGVTVVVRNSKDERELLDYGRRLLPSDQR